MKRLIAIAGAGAMLLSTITPAFAHQQGLQMGTSNSAMVSTIVSSQAVTGGNVQTNYAYKGEVEDSKNVAITGDAGAEALAVTVTNTNLRVGCYACSPASGRNSAFVASDVSSLALTGDNTQSNSAIGGHRSEGEVEDSKNIAVTGDAWSEASAWTVTNTNISWGFGGFR
jgi:pyruvate/2-oxoacid:ferredoxin oxidoreductase beta subunit